MDDWKDTFDGAGVGTLGDNWDDVYAGDRAGKLRMITNDRYLRRSRTYQRNILHTDRASSVTVTFDCGCTLTIPAREPPITSWGPCEHGTSAIWNCG